MTFGCSVDAVTIARHVRCERRICSGDASDDRFTPHSLCPAARPLHALLLPTDDDDLSTIAHEEFTGIH